MEIILFNAIRYLASFLAVLIVLPLHEFAHAYAAVKCGDATPKLMGRYTLNPFAHFDPIGLVMLILLRFGWAKPVPVNPDNFKNYKSGCIWVSIAGVLTNIVFALAICPLYMYRSVLYIDAEWARYINLLTGNFIASLFYLNVGLFVFNLLPIYPLDGFRLYDALIKKRGKVYYFLRNNSLYILLAILILGFIGDSTGLYFLDFVGYITDKISWLIIKLWSFII